MAFDSRLCLPLCGRTNQCNIIVDVNISLNIQIPIEWSDTIGGFVLASLGRFPQKGEKMEYDGYDFNIEELFDYGISRLQVIKKPQRTKE